MIAKRKRFATGNCFTLLVVQLVFNSQLCVQQNNFLWRRAGGGGGAGLENTCNN